MTRYVMPSALDYYDLPMTIQNTFALDCVLSVSDGAAVVAPVGGRRRK